MSIKEFNPSFFHKLHDFLLGGVIHQLPDRFNPSDTSSVAASSAAGDTAGATEKKSKEGSKMKRPAAAHEYHEPLGGGNDGNDDGDDGDENSGDRMSSQNDIPKDLRPPASKRPAAKTTPTPQKKPSRRKNAEDLHDGQFAAVFFNYIQTQTHQVDCISFDFQEGDVSGIYGDADGYAAVEIGESLVKNSACEIIDLFFLRIQ